MLGNARDITPTMLNYKTHADANSLYNTPPCYTIYICKLVLEWIEKLGGLEKMKERNEKRQSSSMISSITVKCSEVRLFRRIVL